MVLRPCLLLCLLALSSAASLADDSPGEIFPNATGDKTQPALSPQNQPAPTPPAEPESPPPATAPATAPAPATAGTNALAADQDASPESPPVEEPKSLRVRQAEAKYNADVQKVAAECATKAAAIKQSYVNELKHILRTIASSDYANADEIAKVSAKIKRIQANGVQIQVANPQSKDISGRWRETVEGASGITDFIFNKDKTVWFSRNNSPIGVWIRDGKTVVFLVHNAQNSYDLLTLSEDGKTMTGISPSFNAQVTYTYLGP